MHLHMHIHISRHTHIYIYTHTDTRVRVLVCCALHCSVFCVSPCHGHRYKAELLDQLAEKKANRASGYKIKEDFMSLTPRSDVRKRPSVLNLAFP